MKNLKELREERAAMLDRVTAMQENARKEGRDNTTEECQEIDVILGVGKDGDQGRKVGKVELLDKQIEREERIEAFQAQQATKRAREVVGGSDSVSTAIRPVAGPLNRQRHGKLFGFENREEAFRAGCWFAATILGHSKAEQYCKDMGVSLAMTTGTGANGGHLVPEEMERAIIRNVETYGVFRQNCRVMPMTSDVLSFPSRTSGVTAYYVAEVPSSITESSPTTKQNQLVAKVLAVRSLISRDLMEDAIIDIANWIAQEVGLAFAQAEDSAGFLGDGTSTYGGITGIKNAVAAGSVYTAITGNTAFSTLDLEDFENMAGMLPQYARANARWYISNVGFHASMARLQMAAGGNTVTQIAGSPVFTFMGYPVVISQVMNSTTGAQTSATGVVYFGDLALSATLGNRRGIETQVLRELYAATRQVGIITSQRYDINVHERGTASVAGPILSMSLPGS